VGEVDPTIVGADVVVAGFAKQRYGDEFFGVLKATRLFVRPFVGFDDVDVDAATRSGVLVCNMADAIYDDVSTQMMALTLATDRQLLVDDRWVREGTGRAPVVACPTGCCCIAPRRKLSPDRPGTIGRAVVRKARAFGYTIIASDPYVDPSVALDLDVELVGLDDLLRRADVVSIHCFLNDETRKMINAEKLALMKSSAVIINTARGADHRRGGADHRSAERHDRRGPVST
jgi:phosphoglycerate dehydrogenase-like enzyme